MPVFDSDLTAFLESGCALIVGLAGPDGWPLASRGWGLDVVDSGSGRVELLVVPDDVCRLVPEGTGAVEVPISVTGADVHSLRSVQLKGTLVRLDPATGDDWERCAAYCDAFFGAVESADRFPREDIGRSAPVRLARATITVTEMFDQTPGPGAGATLSVSRS